MSTLGNWIRNGRIIAGWSQADLAQRCGLSVSFISDIERGRADPSLKTLQLLAKAFEMGAGDLLVEAGYSVRYDAVAARQNAAQVIAQEALERALGEFK